MKRKEIIMILLLAVLGLGYLILRPSGRISYDLPQWKKIDSEKISHLSYGTAGSLKRIELKGSDWITENGNKADPEKMRNILSALQAMTILDKLSDSEDYRRYQLDKDLGTVVEIGLQGETRTFIFGKSAPGGGNYVRFPGEKGVFSINKDMAALFPKDLSALRDKSVITFDPNGLQSLVLTKGKTSVGIKKKGDKWFRDDKELDDKDPIVQIIPGLSQLKCNSFQEGKASGDVFLEVRMIGDKNETLYVYDETKDGYRAASSETDSVFILSKYIVDSWVKAMGV